jgi:hypothetical protein
MVYGEQSMRAGMNPCHGRMIAFSGFGAGSVAKMIGILGLVLLLNGSAFAEFFVSPIILRQQVTPGRRNVRIKFQLENNGRNTTETVSLRIADLTQDENGVWTEVRPDDPNNTVDVSTLRSCKDWLMCPVAQATLDPYQMVPVEMQANIPAGTRGFYFAALVAETAPREMSIDGYTSMMSVQYVVPIILEAQTIPMPAQVSLTGVHLKYVAPTVEEPAAKVIASMDVVNKGGTYSRLQGQIRIWRMSEKGYWVKAANVTLPDNGIIPGITLNLKQDIGILLPSGRYKVEGYLFVDGRRGNAINDELDFVGDVRVVDTRGQAPIDLDKDDLFIDVIPGSTRQGTIQVGNGSEDPISVTAEFILPEHMLHAQMGDIKGDDLGCVDWVTVQNPQFTLQKYGKRNLSLVVRMPPTATQYSNYYGTLRLHATYEDGTPAGVKTANVCIRNGKVAGRNVIDGRTLSIAVASPGRYYMTANFLNGGVTHVTPKCKGVLTGPGDVIYKQFLMDSEAAGQNGILLPFESRTYTGVLDVSDLPDGVYRLTAALQYVGRNAQGQQVVENSQNQVLIEVLEENGQRIAKYAEWDKAPDGKRGKVTLKL